MGQNSGFNGGSQNGLAGVTVNLINITDGELMATTTTDAHGRYSFDVTESGQYQVQLVNPSGAKQGTSSRSVNITRGDQFANGLDFVVGLFSQGGQGWGWASCTAMDDTNWS